MLEAERTEEHLFIFQQGFYFSWRHPYWGQWNSGSRNTGIWLAVSCDWTIEPMGKKLNLEAEREQRPLGKTSETQEWKEGAPQICSENSFSDGLLCFMWLLRCCFVNLNREQIMSNKQTHVFFTSHHLFFHFRFLCLHIQTHTLSTFFFFFNHTTLLLFCLIHLQWIAFKLYLYIFI